MEKQDRELITASRIAGKLYKALTKEKQDEVMDMAREALVIEKYQQAYRKKKDKAD